MRPLSLFPSDFSSRLRLALHLLGVHRVFSCARWFMLSLVPPIMLIWTIATCNYLQVHEMCLFCPLISFLLLLKNSLMLRTLVAKLLGLLLLRVLRRWDSEYALANVIRRF
jgi:hypothetical protein